MTRTMAGPMAFTRDDFIRGAAWTLGSFLALLLIAETLILVANDLLRTPTPPNVATLSSTAFLPLVLGGTVVIGGPIAALCLLVGSPVAYRLARTMRHESRVTVHLIVFALFGALFGALCAGAVVSLLVVMGGAAPSWPAIAGGAAWGAPFTAAAMVIGWLIASGRARRQGRRVRPSRRDQDALFEDSV